MRRKRLTEAGRRAALEFQRHSEGRGKEIGTEHYADVFTKTGLCLCLCEVVVDVLHMTFLTEDGQDWGHRALQTGQTSGRPRRVKAQRRRGRRGGGLWARDSRQREREMTVVVVLSGCSALGRRNASPPRGVAVDKQKAGQHDAATYVTRAGRGAGVTAAAHGGLVGSVARRTGRTGAQAAAAVLGRRVSRPDGAGQRWAGPTGQTDRQAGRQTGRQTDKQTEQQTDRQQNGTRTRTGARAWAGLVLSAGLAGNGRSGRRLRAGGPTGVGRAAPWVGSWWLHHPWPSPARRPSSARQRPFVAR